MRVWTFSLLLLFIYFSACSAGSLKFLIVGDMGGSGEARQNFTSARQLRIANAMGRIGKDMKISFVVALGDNFYETGVKDVSDIRFAETFEKVYTAPSLQVPWYLIAGNHDYYGNAPAEVEYSAKHPKSRWKFPSLNHDLLVDIPGSTANAHLVFMDSFRATPISLHLSLESHGGVPQNTTWAKQTLEWLKETLSSSKASWLLFFTHYPYISTGPHGHNPDIQTQLHPILRATTPHAYIAGHDHNLQALHEDLPQPSSLPNLRHYIIGSGTKVTTVYRPDALPKTSKLLFRYPPEAAPEPVRSDFCDDIKFSCESGAIKIREAVYGRMREEVCHEDGLHNDTSCILGLNRRTDVREYFSKCNGEESCSFTAEEVSRAAPNSNSGDCRLQSKYTYVSYACDYEMGGFASVELTPQQMTIQIHDELGRVIYSQVMDRPNIPTTAFWTFVIVGAVVIVVIATFLAVFLRSRAAPKPESLHYQKPFMQQDVHDDTDLVGLERDA